MNQTILPQTVLLKRKCVYISLYCASAVHAFIWEQFFCVHQGGVSKETATHWPQKLSGNFLEPWAACLEVCVLTPACPCSSGDPVYTSRWSTSLARGVKTQASLPSTAKGPQVFWRWVLGRSKSMGRSFILLLFLFYLLCRCRGIYFHQLSS